MAIKTLLSLALLAKLSAAYTPEALADQIINLPGAENLKIPFNQFSGYLSVPGVATKNLHYWMVESLSNPATDPVAFWTNGGPGCSGLIGFLTEQGPFKPNSDGSLSLNEWTWNQKANMVFVEVPCGVGFSYSDSADDVKTDDKQSAKDNYAMIQAFFKRFPEYASNDLYISSESYGGHYMPTLAREIVDRNTAGADPHLNFKGFAVGNPHTTFYSVIPSSVQSMWGHQLVSKPTWDKYSETCLNARNFDIFTCEILFMEMYLEVGRDFNPYALDYPVCVSDSPSRFGRAQRHWLMRHVLGNSSTGLRAAMGVGEFDGADYEPCAMNYAISYLNRADVKAALHVKTDVTWEECSRSIRYSQKDGAHSMVPNYQYLIDGKFGLDILVFSGDDDSVCSTEGTQNWIWSMGYRVAGRKWRPWTVANQTAGYLTKWANTRFAFMTVHGAGHEVPSYKPQAALDLWNSYLAGELTNE